LLAHPSSRAFAGQWDARALAFRASRHDDVGVAGGGQGLGEADDDRRAARVAGGERIRAGSQVLVKLLQGVSAVRHGMLQGR
jgi:hypothetical protein